MTYFFSVTISYYVKHILITRVLPYVGWLFFFFFLTTSNYFYVKFDNFNLNVFDSERITFNVFVLQLVKKKLKSICHIIKIIYYNL